MPEQQCGTVKSLLVEWPDDSIAETLRVGDYGYCILEKFVR